MLICMFFMCYNLEYRTCLNPVLKNKINTEHNASSFLPSKREHVTASVSTKGGVGRVRHSPICPFPHWTVLPRRQGLVALRLLLLHASGVHGHLLHPHDLWDAQQEERQLADCPQRTPQAGKSPRFPGTRPWDEQAGECRHLLTKASQSAATAQTTMASIRLKRTESRHCHHFLRYLPYAKTYWTKQTSVYYNYLS